MLTLFRIKSAGEHWKLDNGSSPVHNIPEDTSERSGGVVRGSKIGVVKLHWALQGLHSLLHHPGWTSLDATLPFHTPSLSSLPHDSFLSSHRSLITTYTAPLASPCRPSCVPPAAHHLSARGIITCRASLSGGGSGGSPAPTLTPAQLQCDILQI